MCNKKQFKYCPSEIDKCMKNVVEFIDENNNLLDVVACCCGHGKYNMTILMRSCLSGEVFDLVSSKIIHRKRNFYKKDKEGYYYIPETQIVDSGKLGGKS